ncbi:Hsp88-like_protein [Hexamita inflata]|uniref:Hsp88-like protein n=1 Tax=Hexamita inflata TaxID=28002 RepID=A0AA86UCN2_9EUKA|nr:Hsp88-like protein [Hexamita inflata]
MSLLAVDIGNCNMVATVPRGRGIDVVASDTSHKQIPCVISYQAERRYFADSANSQKVSNRNGCFYYLPLILNEQLESDAVKRAVDLGASYPLKAGSDGRAIASVYFGGEQTVVETDSMVAAMVCKVKQFAEAMDIVPKDILTTVPGRWNAHKRAAMRAAVESTGLQSLGVVNQHMAVGMGYYMRRVAEFQAMDKDNAGIKLAILSIGEVESFFTVLQLNKAGITTLSAAYSSEIGSIDYDKAIAEMIERLALKKTKQITLDELKSKKTQIKILKAANTVKKTLSVNQSAPAQLECVGDNQIDIPVLVQGEDFEKIVAELKLSDRIKLMIEEGLKNIDIKEIEAIECVGGASRVRSIQSLVTSIFGESKVTKRMNPDEAVGFGLGWIGAIRSSKYKVPYEINMTDMITNLSEPISLHVVNENGEVAFAKPLELFKNGEMFPKSKKVTLRFAPGKYHAFLKEGEKVHEETTFEIKPKNFEQFKDQEAAKAAGVDFNDQTASVKVKVIADNDGYFKMTSVNRSEFEVVFDDIKKKVPNPEYDNLVAKREEEIKKREEEFVKATEAYELKKKEVEDLIAKDKEEKKEVKRDMPEKPVKSANPPEPAKEIEVSEKVPRIANMSSELNIEFVSGLYNVQKRALELRQFELKCQKIDQESLAYDAAINAIESIIYNTRDGIEYSLKQHISEEEAAKINALLDEAHEYSQSVEGKHQIAELLAKTSELETKLKPYFDRKQSHADLESQLYRTKSELEQLKSKYSQAESTEIFEQIDKKIQSYYTVAEQLDKKLVVPNIFEDFQKFYEEIEKKLKDLVEQKRKAEEEQKKKAEEAKKAEEEKKKAEKVEEKTEEKK